ncbi:hypothetical protein TIFTF001_030999 [Ficus carica]|uniref:Uncharacterized protein n=1 Tax=Ficus carica TaxID=3494 RepID=A0AA88J5Q9_FICCA|nr:hypothetical protein TIFTF001_030999 [Ficus carica]
MSYLSDSENLSESVDVTGSSTSTSSTSSSSAGESMGQRGRTPDHLSGFSDIPSPSDLVSPTSREQGGAARLEEILQAGPTEGGDASKRTASQASMSGREDTPGSESSDLSGEHIQARQRPRSRAMRINDIKVYRRADIEMVDLADNRPVYTADYYTSAFTRRYLDALRQEFRIPDDVDLVVPRADDLPSRPPPGYVALSAEYFLAGLRLPLHPFLRRALIRLNVALAQLNANAYLVLVGCFILWAAKFTEKLPFGAFQNIYRMKTALSSKGFYYFQGFKGTFITGCPDSDKQFKHLWFYAGGRWLHGHLAYDEVPPSEMVPVMFRRGYVWTRAPHIPGLTMAKIDALQELSDPERSQHTEDIPIKGHGRAHARTCRPLLLSDKPSRSRDHRRSVWSSTGGADSHDPWATVWRPVPWNLRSSGRRRGHGPGDPGTLPCPGPPDRRATATPVSKTSQPVTRPDARSDKPREDRPKEDRTAGRHEARSSRSREDRPTVPFPASRSNREEPRPPRSWPPSPESSVHRALVTKFGDQLSVEVAEPSKRSDPIEAINDSTSKLIEALCLLFSKNAAARGYANRMADEVKSAEADARSSRRSEKEARAAKGVAEEARKEAEDRAKAAEERVKLAEEKLRFA